MWESKDLIKKPINWDKPPKDRDGAWHANIRLIDPNGEEFTKSLQSIPITRKLSKRESPRELIDLDHFSTLNIVTSVSMLKTHLCGVASCDGCATLGLRKPVLSVSLFDMSRGKRKLTKKGEEISKSVPHVDLLEQTKQESDVRENPNGASNDQGAMIDDIGSNIENFHAATAHAGSHLPQASITQKSQLFQDDTTNQTDDDTANHLCKHDRDENESKTNCGTSQQQTSGS
ncbi:hypothetical protein Tco_0331917 [Tanacetum coccineum]